MKYILIFCCIACMSIMKINGQTGIPVPEMGQCDELVKKFLADYDIPGATFALSKDGKIVYMRAFGFSDTSKTTPTQPYNLFRIASLSKPITSIAIMKLVENGQLDISSKVFGPGSILQDHPVFSNTIITDSRIYDITLQNLLEHSAGWDRSINCAPDPTTPYPWFFGGCDPIVFPLHVTEQTRTTNPVTGEALIKFLLQKGLDFTPNTGYAYSNVGYLVLGEIIEQITGKSYTDYVKNNILAPLGIYDMHIANNFLSEKQEREVEYFGYGPGYETLSAYGDGTFVPREYGGYNITAMDAHGGWIATARDLVRLLVAVDGFSTKPDILQPATITTMTTPSANASFYAKGWTVNSANNWWHTGSLPGTASILVRTSGGYTWTVILNKRNIQDPNFFGALDALPWHCIAATSSWPTFDLMQSPTVNASGITFSNVTSNSITVNWTKGNGDDRLLVVRPDSAINRYPLDGTGYAANQNVSSSTSLGADNYIVYNGKGTSVTVTGLTPCKKYYFRIIEYNKNTGTGNISLYQLGNNAQNSAATVPDIKTTIADARALNSGVNVNTVYLGYAPASSLTLTAGVIGGSGTLTYRWSNGATTPSITVSPTTTTTNTVAVSDGRNCKVTATKQVTVVDVRCGNKKDKVTVCHSGGTVCVTSKDVKDHLNHGDKLGDCSTSSAITQAVSSRAPVEDMPITNTRSGVYPNPNNGQFTLQLNNGKGGKAEVSISNAEGVTVERRTVQLTGKGQTLSFNLVNKATGLYMVKVVSEDGVQTMRVAVQR